MRELDPSKTYLITGGAGFIGFHLSKSLLERGAQVIGFDNMNDYYDVKLKEDRLAILDSYDKYSFIRGDLSDNADVFRVFQEYRPQIVVNLGAQAGVRYSIDNPGAYMAPCAGRLPVLPGGTSGVRLFQFRLRRKRKGALFHGG